MASPPNYSNTSPPAPSPLALPRQRPSLSLPTGILRRKTSVTSATSSSHPLRQTSFPGGGDNSAVYSPEDSADISDSEITSAISGATGEPEGNKKRKRGEKRNRGRPPKNPGRRQGSQSVVNDNDDAKSRRSGALGGDSVIAGEGEGDEDDDDDDDADGGDRAGAYEQDRFIANDRARIDLHQQMPVAQQERHDSWHRAKLKTSDVRRLVNQTLSQSVPANVVTVVQAYTKMFAGLLIEGAREVQSEWIAVESQRADGQDNPAAKRLRLNLQDDTKAHDKTAEPDSTQSDTQTLPNGTPVDAEIQQTDVDGVERVLEQESGPQSRSMGLRRTIDECDRGPLLPDHLRESLRRYKKSRYGGTVGFTGLSLEGRDVAAARSGRRRMFR